jgi:hypothetical protein
MRRQPEALQDRGKGAKERFCRRSGTNRQRVQGVKRPRKHCSRQDNKTQQSSIGLAYTRDMLVS